MDMSQYGGVKTGLHIFMSFYIHICIVEIIFRRYLYSPSSLLSLFLSLFFFLFLLYFRFFNFLHHLYRLIFFFDSPINLVKYHSEIYTLIYSFSTIKLIYNVIFIIIRYVYCPIYISNSL